jgi:hypothetical protein
MPCLLRSIGIEDMPTRDGFRDARITPVLIALLTLIGSDRLSAQTARRSLYDKFEVNVSATGIFVNSKIRIDGSDGPGTEIDAEDDLGLAKLKLQPRASLRWRPGRRHELELGYQFARRTGETTLQRTIDFGDSTYVLGTDVHSQLNSDQAFLTYRFAFLAKERSQVGAGLGLGALLVDTRLQALGDDEVVDWTQEKKVTAPVGSLGLFGRFLSGDRWYFEVDARYFAVIIDRYDAQVLDLGAAARYFLSPSFGIEAGYGGSGIEVDVGPKDTIIDRETLAGGRLKFSLQNVRLGLVWLP